MKTGVEAGYAVVLTFSLGIECAFIQDGGGYTGFTFHERPKATSERFKSNDSTEFREHLPLPNDVSFERFRLGSFASQSDQPQLHPSFEGASLTTEKGDACLGSSVRLFIFHVNEGGSKGELECTLLTGSASVFSAARFEAPFLALRKRKGQKKGREKGKRLQ